MFPLRLKPLVTSPHPGAGPAQVLSPSCRMISSTRALDLLPHDSLPGTASASSAERRNGLTAAASPPTGAACDSAHNLDQADHLGLPSRSSFESEFTWGACWLAPGQCELYYINAHKPDRARSFPPLYILLGRYACVHTERQRSGQKSSKWNLSQCPSPGPSQPVVGFTAS